MGKRKYIIGSILICAALMIGITYHGRKHSRVITLEFGMFAGSNWDVANANSYTIIDKAIKKFESENKNVKIHYYSGVLKSDYSEWISRRMLKGKMPDVFMVLTDDFDKFSGMGVMLNLDNMMSKDSNFNPNRFYKTTLNTGKYNGKQYALPYETVPELMFINKTLLEREGIKIPDNDWSWEDMYRICSMVTKDTNGDGILDQFGTYNYTWTQAVYSNGVSLFDDSGTQANFMDEKVIEGIKFIKKIYALNQGIKVSRDDFDNGNVAFTPLLFSDYRTYKTYPYKIKKYNRFKWDCITLPAGPNGGNASTINTLLMGISSTTQYKNLSWKFLKTLTCNPEIQLDIFRYSQGISVLEKVTQSQEAEEILQKDMEKSEKTIDNDLISSVITKGTIEPKFQKYKEALTLADNEITKIIEGDTNIDSTMKIFQRSINSYLKR